MACRLADTEADAENATTDAFDKGFYFVHVPMEVPPTSKSFIFISQIGSETMGEITCARRPRHFENDEGQIAATSVIKCN